MAKLRDFALKDTAVFQPVHPCGEKIDDVSIEIYSQKHKDVWERFIGVSQAAAAEDEHVEALWGVVKRFTLEGEERDLEAFKALLLDTETAFVGQQLIEAISDKAFFFERVKKTKKKA